MAGVIYLAWWVAAVSLLAVGAAVSDKSRARRGGRRIRERSLLLLALLGGSPGLIIAMVVVRHKTRKTSFLARLAIVLVVQALGLWWAWRVGFLSEV